jgi:hypothetical protein
MPSITPTGAGLATPPQTHGSTKWYKDRTFCRSNDCVKSGTETPHCYSVYQGRGHFTVTTGHDLTYYLAPSQLYRLAVSLVVHD